MQILYTLAVVALGACLFYMGRALLFGPRRHRARIRAVLLLLNKYHRLHGEQLRELMPDTSAHILDKLLLELRNSGLIRSEHYRAEHVGISYSDTPPEDNMFSCEHSLTDRGRTRLGTPARVS